MNRLHSIPIQFRYRHSLRETCDFPGSKWAMTLGLQSRLFRHQLPALWRVRQTPLKSTHTPVPFLGDLQGLLCFSVGRQGPGRCFTGKKKVFRYTAFPKKPAGTPCVGGGRLAVGGW